MADDLPVQPVPEPILCSPFEEPTAHWVYDRGTGAASKNPSRRPAGYYFKSERTAKQAAQTSLFGTQEEHDLLPLVNHLRAEVKRWRKDYRGASRVTKELLRHWARSDRARRLFFCQREAVETMIYLAEIRLAGRSRSTGFKRFEVSDEDLQRMLAGKRPAFFQGTSTDHYPMLADPPQDAEALGLPALRRLGCKMATGSGKTVVMSMLISWAFCNRARNPRSTTFPNAVLIVCPNLTVKERLQVLRPERPDNYYEEFDIVPAKYRPLLQQGRVLVTNWHAFQPESENKEGGSTYTVVQKGPETPETFARRLLGDLYERMPILVFNDEAHHCWRPAPSEEKLDRSERELLKAEQREATVWVDGLDRLNAHSPDGKAPGISYVIDLSATPFYIKGSGYPEGRPFPWLVTDFGLVDAIESGITKIPRLPVVDTTGRPDPMYFRLWEGIRDRLEPGEFLPGRARKPKPDVVYREAEGALQQIAGQWVERFKYNEAASPGQDRVPPVLIVVCDNTDIARIFFEKISGEREEEIVTEEDVAEAAGAPKKRRRRKKARTSRTVFGRGAVYPDYFSNTATARRTVRIDSKLLEKAESADPSVKAQDAAEQLRRLVSTVGKVGEPGEHVRCVVSVSMLTEGWDANNVTHILGVRAFGSQLLCEQVVGRGLRRMNYTPDPETGLFPAEYVDVYGIPFSVIPFKGRPTKQTAPEDKPKFRVRAVPERAERMEMRFPVVEGYAFALKRNAIKANIDATEVLVLEPNVEPTATFLTPTVGYREGPASHGESPFGFVEQSRQEYYDQTHEQAIQFQITQMIVAELSSLAASAGDAKGRVLRLSSRHQLFPQVLRIVQEYVDRKVDFQGCDRRELGLEKYVMRIVERLRDAIEPNDEEGESPLLPVLNRYKPIGTTAEVDFITTRRCHATEKSHINQVVLDTKTWESSATFRLEQSDVVDHFARNDRLGLVIPYEYMGVDHGYEPDFLVKLTCGVTLVLEIKGFEDEKTRAKHQAAKRWVDAVNYWGHLDRWAFHGNRKPQLLGKELAYLDDEQLTPPTSTPGGPGADPRSADNAPDKMG